MQTFKHIPFSVDGDTHLQIKPYRMNEEDNTMDFLKALFESGALTWEQFSEAVNQKGYKVVDLSTGNYVAKKKYEDELKSKDDSIAQLNTQIGTRDTDIADLKKKLEDGGKDNATKVKELSDQIAKLQGDYETAKNDYEGKLKQQSYEFAVKEFANGKKFSSNAAKRDFINEMLGKNLVLENNVIMGAEDFAKSYAEANADAFIVDTPPTTEPKPTFVTPATPKTPPAEENAFLNAFNFAGVRPKNEK